MEVGFEVLALRREDVKVCIARTGGTNCDLETKIAFEELGVKVDLLHSKRLLKENMLLDYELLVFPGGFSYGDYVRAGAIWAKTLFSQLYEELINYVEEERLIMGICNGFQVLVEMGLLPAFSGVTPHPEATLSTNLNAKYECRWVYLKYENRGNCVFTKKLESEVLLKIPIGHGEGRFLFPKGKEREYLKKLIDGDQLVFRYAKPDGSPAEGTYPFNPNGSLYDIAGICNPEGNVFGLMPHPERAFFGWQLPDWTCLENLPKYGDGWFIFKSAIQHICENF